MAQYQPIFHTGWENMQKHSFTHHSGYIRTNFDPHLCEAQNTETRLQSESSQSIDSSRENGIGLKDDEVMIVSSRPCEHQETLPKHEPPTSVQLPQTTQQHQGADSTSPKSQNTVHTESSPKPIKELKELQGRVDKLHEAVKRVGEALEKEKRETKRLKEEHKEETKRLKEEYTKETDRLWGLINHFTGLNGQK
jgi:hypothetical protein